MDWADIAKTAFMTIYTVLLVVVCVYGLHRYALVLLYWRHRKNEPRPAGHFDELPRVTIQLPMFNERYVARRIIEKTCEIRYPREKLQIQVLDDSTDETTAIARRTCEEFRVRGFDVEFIHREDRTGFKAGALANAMPTAKGDFITIFDADFIPEPSFLEETIHYFTDPKVCVVQSRWEHLNRENSLLTKSQAIFLDGHFAIEHISRNRSGRFMSFNGTGGTWRRAAIEDAGGWRHDTLTEDLDLSYRAQLKGWKFVFLPDMISPCELPPEMSGFKAQQFRWTKGGVQNALRLLPKVMLSSAPLKVKVEAFFHLTGFMLHIFMLALVLLMFPAMYLQCLPVESGTAFRTIVDLSIFTLATMSATVFYCASQGVLSGNWRMPLKYLPLMIALGVGLCISNTKAILEALLGRKSGFVRTPKYGEDKAGDAYVDQQHEVTPKPVPKRKRNWLVGIEIAMGLYMVACLLFCVFDRKAYITSPFLVIFAFGFFYVAFCSLQAGRVKQTQPRGEARPQPSETASR
jgi:cellulose synthase/poly-beta-1,6-N-acetylglucosamine synthase-like glycosyltransferase